MSKVAERKPSSRTSSEKYKILKELDKGESSVSISKKYGIPKQTLSGWSKEKKENIFRSRKKPSAKRVRMHVSLNENLNKACHMWLLNTQHQNIPVSGTIFKVKALHFAKELGCENFQASNEWLDRWKKRNNLSFTTISGESQDVTNEMTATRRETTLPTILSHYNSRDIFNADEFGFLIKHFQKKSMHLKADNLYELTL
ncbi:tigger transposable element-derived protein 4-like [Hydra vulgaris]|uniref:Tigger transposable element-derived protein 4-like n=1 Tax=Hydra vulgaris TaxID=6087 RepID=A0ABM4DHB5_HYDVU